MTAPTDAAIAYTATGVASGMAASSLVDHAAALRTTIGDFATVAVSQLVSLFGSTDTSAPDFPELVQYAVPQIVQPLAQSSALVTSQWYDELAPAATYRSTPAGDIPAERIDKSVNWALYAPTPQNLDDVPDDENGHDHSSESGLIFHDDEQPSGLLTEPDDETSGLTWQDNPDVTLSRLSGSVKRMVYDASRDTVVSNATQEGVRWVRVAQPDACAFCRMLATRSAVYHSQALALRGASPYSESYHDHCRCVAVPVRAGSVYTPPDYVQQWMQDYNDAVDATKKAGRSKGKNGAIDFKAVLSQMRSLTDAK